MWEVCKELPCPRKYPQRKTLLLSFTLRENCPFHQSGPSIDILFPPKRSAKYCCCECPWVTVRIYSLIARLLVCP
ncbi:hypothetical protein EVAR_52657_1 [Eumeta japonica]|uniref:Uncharacterized protein n=1 Tax=Eumeta variegata TaxID=151549 RepID=A0A4C1Z441_EUMVA|nr:hypothetical protein EVAR_52657_1 [Eumeta japonica]